MAVETHRIEQRTQGDAEVVDLTPALMEVLGRATVVALAVVLLLMLPSRDRMQRWLDGQKRARMM